MKKIWPLLILGVILFRLGTYLLNQRVSFSKFDPEAYRRVYLNSNYVKKGGASISDYIVYTHAGWEYIQGKNPTLINPEQPPLGKYLIGLSLLLFQYPGVFSLLASLGSLILVWLIAKAILKSTVLSLAPMAILTFEPLFINQTEFALLDLYHLFFILLAFYFFLRAINRPKFFILSSLALGGVIAVKFYSTGIIIAASWLTYLVLNRDFAGLKKLLTTLPLAVLVLMVAYGKIFLEGESLRRFFGIQKWMWEFHTGGKFLVPPGAIWQLIFLKKWVTWWADRRPLPAPDWQISWPISIVISFLVGAASLAKKISLAKEAQVVLIWVVIYLASLSFGIIYPRYLLPLLPFTYILSLAALQKLFLLLRILLQNSRNP